MRYCSGVACWQEAHSRRCQNECQRESRSFHETLLNLDPNYGSGCCCDISKCSSRSAEGLAEWNNTSEAFFPPFLDTLLLCKYFDMRSLMDFAFISKHLRNVLACHMITFRELCLPPPTPTPHPCRPPLVDFGPESRASLVLLPVIRTLDQDSDVPNYGDESHDIVSQNCQE